MRREDASLSTDLIVGETDPALGEAARRVVAGAARGSDDAAFLLDALGLR